MFWFVGTVIGFTVVVRFLGPSLGVFVLLYLFIFFIFFLFYCLPG